MSELILDRDEKLALRARAHHLRPVVLLGSAGLTDAIIKEADRALAAHELIKVRIPGDDRDQREAICGELAGRLGAARIQAIGKLLVLYRPRPEVEAAEAAPAARRSAAAPSRPKDIKARRPKLAASHPAGQRRQGGRSRS
jgi:putative YhbY family RNA-binding protein